MELRIDDDYRWYLSRISGTIFVACTSIFVFTLLLMLVPSLRTGAFALFSAWGGAPVTPTWDQFFTEMSRPVIVASLSGVGLGILLRRPSLAARVLSWYDGIGGNRLAIGAALSVGLAGVLMIRLWFPSTFLERSTEDDAYITYQYARNLARGDGLVFNPGDRTDSASSHLYTFLLALLYKVGVVDLPRVSAWVSLVSGVTALALMFSLGLVLGLQRIELLLFLAALGLSGRWLAWSGMGMDAAFAVMFVLATFLSRALEERHPRLWTLTGVLAALQMVARYEGVLLVIVLLIVDMASPASRRQAIRRAFVTGAILSVWAAWKLYYYHSLIPDSFIFRNFETRYYGRSPLFLLGFLQREFLWLCIFGVIGIALGMRVWIRGVKIEKDLARTWLTMVTWVVVFLTAALMGPRSEDQRYVAPAMPVMTLLAAYAVGTIARHRVKAVRLIGLIGLGLILLHTIIRIPITGRYYLAGETHQTARLEVGKWLNENTPPGTPLLSSDVGAIAWSADRPIIDALGLVSRHIFRARLAGKADRYIVCQQPPYIADTTMGLAVENGHYTAAELRLVANDNLVLDFSERETPVNLLRDPRYTSPEMVFQRQGTTLFFEIWRLNWHDTPPNCEEFLQE